MLKYLVRGGRIELSLTVYKTVALAVELTPFGASGENQTLVLCLEGRNNSHYTTLAVVLAGGFEPTEGIKPADLQSATFDRFAIPAYLVPSHGISPPSVIRHPVGNFAIATVLL